MLGCSWCHVVPILFRRVKTISPDIKEFFSQACSLRHVSLAGTKLPADAVRCDWAVGNGFGMGIAWGELGQGWWGGWMDARGCERQSSGKDAFSSIPLPLPALLGCPMAGAGAPISGTDGGSFGDFSRALLQGLADNSHISDLHLDLSSCEVRAQQPWAAPLRPGGPTVAVWEGLGPV